MGSGIGLFPTLEELQKMHESLTRSRRTTTVAGSTAKSGKVDLEEFIHMVEILTIAKLSQSQRIHLVRLFDQFSEDMVPDDGLETIDINSPIGIGPPSFRSVKRFSISEDRAGMSEKPTKGLKREGLSELMKALGHPASEVEQEYMMHEWDVDDTGYISLDSFISMVATVLKTEELDTMVEQDFLRMAGNDNKMIRRISICDPEARSAVVKEYGGPDSLLDIEITTKSLIKAFKKYAPEKKHFKGVGRRHDF